MPVLVPRRYQASANRPDWGEHGNAFSTNLSKTAASDQNSTVF